MASVQDSTSQCSADRYDAIGVSALNIDRIIRIDSLDQLDNEIVIAEETVNPGGSAANTICGLARLGVSTALVGAVGSDQAGRTLLESFSDVGTHTYLISVKDVTATGETICLTDRNGRRLIVVKSGANDRLIEEDINSKVGSLQLPARLIHLSSFVSDDQLAMQVRVAACAAQSSVVSLSPGALYARRGIAGVAPLAAACDVLFANRDEMGALMAIPAYEYAVAALRFLDKFARCQAVVVTLGAGDEVSPDLRVPPDKAAPQPGIAAERVTSRVFVRGGPSIAIVSAERPHLVDATGAGDAFTAGYLYGRLSGEGTARCALFGHVLAQFVLSGMGARANLPSPAQFRGALDHTRAHAILM